MADELVQEDLGEEEIERDQYLTFSIESQEFGFQAMRLQEISALLDITQVPNAPPYIEGVMNLRGRLASVISFRKKFGFPSKPHDADARIVVTEHGGFPIGIIVDTVEEVLKIPHENVQELPESTSTSVSEEYITGVAMLEDRLIILLDVAKVLTKGESIEVAAIADVADEPDSGSEEA